MVGENSRPLKLHYEMSMNQNGDYCKQHTSW